MKYFLIFGVCILGITTTFAQQLSAKQLQETSRTQLQKGDYDNAVRTLERAKLQEPINIEVLKDLSFANYLKRDFARAIEVGKEMTELPDADPQCFQILGLSYKGIAAYKEGAKLYKAALKKFPGSGVIYNEYAELLALDKSMDEAIGLWEKGIELDPGYSSNYYNATMYYSRSKNWMRTILYGEIFLNLESFSTRTGDIKPVLFDAYKNILAPSVIGQFQNAKTTTTFEKAVLESLGKAASTVKSSASVEDITSIRTHFIVDWLQEKQARYPFRLFDHQQYLLSQGLFEAYNYWLFSASANEGSYKIWQNNHPKEMEGFKTFQESRVFKIPGAQYYFSR